MKTSMQKWSFWICPLKFWIKHSFSVNSEYISFTYTCVYWEFSMCISLSKSWYLKAGWKSLPQRKGFFSVLLMCEKTSCWTCWEKKKSKWFKKRVGSKSKYGLNATHLKTWQNKRSCWWFGKKQLCFPVLSYITDLQEKAECDHFACAKRKKRKKKVKASFLLMWSLNIMT